MKFVNITPIDTISLSKNNVGEGYVLDSSSSVTIDFNFVINVTIINIHLLSTENVEVLYSTDSIDYTSFEKSSTSNGIVYSILVNPYIVTDYLRYL
jgi:hypothetical protein